MLFCMMTPFMVCSQAEKSCADEFAQKLKPVLLCVRLILFAVFFYFDGFMVALGLLESNI